MEAIQNWKEKNGFRNPVVLVVAGKCGVGKSTLINNLLELLKNLKCTEIRSGSGVGFFYSKEVIEYTCRVSGIFVKIIQIDTPSEPFVTHEFSFKLFKAA